MLKKKWILFVEYLKLFHMQIFILKFLYKLNCIIKTIKPIILSNWKYTIYNPKRLEGIIHYNVWIYWVRVK